MTYAPTTWVEKVTKVGPTNLNKLELGLQAAAAVADSALPTPAGTDGQLLQRVSGVWVPHTLVATDVPSGIAISKLADPTAGKVIGSSGGAAAVFPPGYELAYVEFTADVTVSATAEATPNDVVSAGSVTFDGTAVWVEFFAPDVLTGTAAGAQVICNLWQDATNLGFLGVVTTPAAAALDGPMLGKRRMTPAAGAHTLKVSAWRTGSNGQVKGETGGAGSRLPGYIRITKA